jgi:hypothetical protein
MSDAEDAGDDVSGEDVAGADRDNESSRPARRRRGLMRWRFWESEEWEALLERLAMRGFWVAFGVILVFAFVYAANGFPFNRVFETVIALAGAALIFAFALKSNDGVMRFLGMMLIAALIISPDDILRLARSLQNQEEARDESNIEADVHRFNVFDTRTVALDLHAMLEEFDRELTVQGRTPAGPAGLGKFGNIATIEDSILRGFIGCVLDDAVARSVASSMRSSELYQTYRTILLEEFHEIDFRAPDRDDIDGNLDDLKALGVLDYPEQQRGEFAVTRLGCAVMWEFESLRLEYRRRLRSGEELPCQAELNLSKDPQLAAAHTLPVAQADRADQEAQQRRCIDDGLLAARASGHLQPDLQAYYGTARSYSEDDWAPSLDALGRPRRTIDYAGSGLTRSPISIQAGEWFLVELDGMGEGVRIEVRGGDDFDPVMRLYDANGGVIDTIDDSEQQNGIFSLNPSYRVSSGTAVPGYLAVRGFGFSAGDAVIWIGSAAD